MYCFCNSQSYAQLLMDVTPFALQSTKPSADTVSYMYICWSAFNRH